MRIIKTEKLDYEKVSIIFRKSFLQSEEEHANHVSANFNRFQQ